MIRTVFILLSIILINSCAIKQSKPINNNENNFIESINDNIKEIIKLNNCVIVRDNWGVPHIYGKTDADAAFGLAYAQAEDDFFTLQETVLKARGKYASVYGPGKNRINAILDYLAGLLKVWDTVNNYYSTLDESTINLCEGYADGINYYIENNKETINEFIYPVSSKDIIAGTTHKTPFFFQLPFFLYDLSEKKPEDIPSHYTIGESLDFISKAEGSNVYAVSPESTDNKSTFLAINSHQPWDGELAWYEAHIHSEEGWNMVGGLFPGSPVVFVGHNDYLGWGHTVNKPDILDIYELEINPENENQYKFDDEWKNLETFDIEIEIKIGTGKSLIKHTETAYWSIHGPVIKGKEATYAIRYSKFDDIRIIEQWYKMNKSKNLEEWTEAMEMMSMPMFNAGYADKEGNILYVYNAGIPIRNEKYDWQKVLPGNTSETLWTDYIPYDMLPKVINPKKGFIQNCNSSPYQTTADDDNPEKVLSKTAGIEEFMTNRALRALETFGIDSEISYDEFKKYKFDLKYSDKSNIAELVKKSIELLKNKKNFKKINRKNLASALNIFSKWDLDTHKDNLNTALPVISFGKLIDVPPEEISNKKIIDSISWAISYLNKHHKRLDVRWGNINRLIRGETDLELSGGPDIARAIYAIPTDKGHLKGVAGDCYILLVQWDSEGIPISESIHQYGSSTINKNSKHYDDQAELFAEEEFKKISINLDEISKDMKSYKILK